MTADKQTETLDKLRRRRAALDDRLAVTQANLGQLERQLLPLALEYAERRSRTAAIKYAGVQAEQVLTQDALLTLVRAQRCLDGLIGERERKAEQDRATVQTAEIERMVEVRYRQELPSYQRIIAKFRRQGEFGQAAIYERELDRLRDGLREQLTPPVLTRQGELRDAADGQRHPQSP